MTNDTATLTLGAPNARLQISWLRYDGEDCFGQHIIEFTDDDGTQRYDFGACTIRCLRKLESILSAETDSVGFGFRIPEIIYYDVDRLNDSIRFHVHSQELDINATMTVKAENVVFDKPFRRFYESK